MKYFKFYVTIIVMVLLMIMSTTPVVFADPMDPMNKVSATDAVTTVKGESIAKNQLQTTISGSESTSTDDDYTQEEWEEEEKTRKGVQIMDSIMYLAGLVGFVLPVLYMGLYLGARIMPSIFMPLYRFITRGRVQPEDIPVHIMFLRTIPVACIGVFMMTGQLRVVFKYIWNFVVRTFLK